jgi:hypothetical protein
MGRVMGLGLITCHCRFIDSEADLDSALKSLLSLAQSPVLAYPELVRSGSVSLLIGLLSHENADIVIDVVDVIHELTDEDVGNELEDEEEQEEAQVALKILMEALVRFPVFWHGSVLWLSHSVGEFNIGVACRQSLPVKRDGRIR